jgi:CxC2 like cysteine cluster associated with KDZ transposases
MHKLEPYHTIQQWNGNCFVQSTLHDLGLVLDLGHGGDCCPAYKNSPDLVGSDFSFSYTECSKGSMAEDDICVVHTSGVFCSRVRYCGCIDPPEHHIQLLRLKLFPASFVRPNTAFTFALLDHFEIDAMECKTSAMNFFAKLKRLTSNAFPHEVPVGD